MNSITPPVDLTSPNAQAALRGAIEAALRRNSEAIGERLDIGPAGISYLGCACMFIAELKRLVAALEGVDAWTAYEAITPHLLELSGEDEEEVAWAATVGETDGFGNHEDPVAYFMNFWEAITAYRLGPLERTRRWLERNETFLPMESCKLPKGLNGFARFLRFCMAFATLSGGSAVIYIPTRAFGEALGQSGKTISRYCHLALRLKLFRLVKKGSLKGRRAHTFELQAHEIDALFSGRYHTPRAVE